MNHFPGKKTRRQVEELRVKNDVPTLIKVGDYVYSLDQAATKKEERAKQLTPEQQAQRRKDLGYAQ